MHKLDFLAFYKHTTWLKRPIYSLLQKSNRWAVSSIVGVVVHHHALVTIEVIKFEAVVALSQKLFVERNPRLLSSLKSLKGHGGQVQNRLNPVLEAKLGSVEAKVFFGSSGGHTRPF